MRIQGIGAVVTGGGSGLGEATARLLAERGAKVAILDLGRSKGAEVAKSIGGDALFCEADVADEAAVTAALDEAAGSTRRSTARASAPPGAPSTAAASPST